MPLEFKVVHTESFCLINETCFEKDRMVAIVRERRLSMVVNLQILEAINVTVKPGRSREALFVRYYLSTDSGNGNTDIAVNTREVMATPDPQWNQNFFLACGVSTDNDNAITELQKQSVRFELRERSRRIRVLRTMFNTASRLLGWVEMPWKNLLASPTLSINSWFPLKPNSSRGSQLPPSLHLAISVYPLKLVEYSIPQSRQEHHTDMKLYDPDVMSSMNEITRKSVNVNRRIRRLDRDACRCGGRVCQQGLHDDGIFAGLS